MKRIFLSVILASSLTVSCSGKKSIVNSQDSNSGSVEDTYESYADNVGVAKTKTEESANEKNSSETPNEPPTISAALKDDGFDYEGLFKDLKMSDDQIRKFTMGMENFSTKKINTPNGEMMGTLEDERMRQLENVLTSEQMESYRKMQ